MTGLHLVDYFADPVAENLSITLPACLPDFGAGPVSYGRGSSLKKHRPMIVLSRARFFKEAHDVFMMVFYGPL